MNEGEQMFGAKKNLSTIWLTAWFVVSLLAFLLIGWNFLASISLIWLEKWGVKCICPDLYRYYQQGCE